MGSYKPSSLPVYYLMLSWQFLWNLKMYSFHGTHNCTFLEVLKECSGFSTPHLCYLSYFQSFQVRFTHCPSMDTSKKGGVVNSSFTWSWADILPDRCLESAEEHKLVSFLLSGYVYDVCRRKPARNVLTWHLVGDKMSLLVFWQNRYRYYICDNVTRCLFT